MEKKLNKYQRYKILRDIYYSKDNWKRRNEIFVGLKQLVDEGYGRAASLLGHVYNEMEITDADYKEEKKWYRIAASLGDGEGIYNMAYEYRDNLPEWLKMVKIAADKNYPMAVFAYADAIFQERPYLAVEYYKKASKLHYYDANYRLAFIYRYGLNYVPVDHKLAAYYALKNYKVSHYYGMSFIGQFFDFGIGMRKNYKKARECYLAAIDENDYVAYGYLARHYLYGLGGLKRDYNLAFEYLNKAIERHEEKNESIFYYELSSCYRLGLGTPKNSKKAKEFYDKWMQRDYFYY